LFGAYWDDELTQAEREWLESHFSSCRACREEYEQFARTLEAVGSLPRAEVTPGLAEKALARARRTSPAPDRLPSGTPAWVPATAAVALAVIAITVVLQLALPLLALRGGTGARMATVPQPVLVKPTSTRVPVAGGATVQRGGGVIPDSLFDHSEDVEFVLDPVTVRKGRPHPASRLAPQTTRGDQAVITF
jgi:anti-sigma factor RsiW